MSTEQLSKNGQESLSKDSLNAILAHFDQLLKIRYEFSIRVQIRDKSHYFHKSLYRPAMPLSCDNICIDTGYYTVQKRMVDFDERTVHLWLAPIIIHRVNSESELEAFEQIIKELKEGGWRE